MSIIQTRTAPFGDIDSPLSAVSDDALGRVTYADRVADIICARRGDHSAVFAIYGEWGSGKTTFKNFVLQNLRERAEHAQPVVVEFNPWEWEGPRQVAEAFFAKIAEEIGSNVRDGGAEVSERLSRYAAYFTLGASVAESAGTILPLFVPGVGPLASLLGKVLKGAGEQTKTGSEAKQKAPSLSELRAALIDSIRKLNRTILVTIDDVDRLTTLETAILFQLLKSNADFPNVIYLVLCDREVVAQNLGDVVAGRGDDYLEKIVQLGLPLPKAYPDQLRRELHGGLTRVMTAAGVEKFLDQRLLNNLVDQHAESFFRTMRDVKRFLANVETLLPTVVHDGQLDVDLMDFIGVELLRTFDHELYEDVYCYRSRITGREGVPSEDKEFLETLTGDRPANGPAMGVFGELFPRFGPAKTLKTRPRGVAHPRSFDRYFAFAIPPDQYSPAEEDLVLARRGDLGFKNDLEDARKRGRLQYLLELLGGADTPVDHESVATYISTLGSFADSLHIDEGAEDVTSYRGQIERLMYSALQPFDVSTRSDILVTACEKSGGLWFPMAFESHFSSREPAAITDDAKLRLREITTERLSSARGGLSAHPVLGQLLLWWLDKGDAEAARNYANELLANDRTVLNLVDAFSRLTVVNNGKARKRIDGYGSFARELDRLVPIDKVLARLGQVDGALLNSRQREIVRAFRNDAQRIAEADTRVQVSAADDESDQMQDEA